MKRLCTIFVTLIMVFTLCVPANASMSMPSDDQDGGIGPVLTYHITGNGVNLRSQAVINPNNIIGLLYYGEYCDVLETQGDWTRVHMTSGYNCGKTGWVYSIYVAPGYVY